MRVIDLEEQDKVFQTVLGWMSPSEILCEGNVIIFESVRRTEFNQSFKYALHLSTGGLGWVSHDSWAKLAIKDMTPDFEPLGKKEILDKEHQHKFDVTWTSNAFSTTNNED